MPFGHVAEWLKLFAVIAGELEGSWRAGGQQEGLQYNGEAAWQKGISDIFCKCCIGGCEETQACFSKRS